MTNLLLFKDWVNIGASLVQSVPAVIVLAGGAYSCFRFLIKPINKLVKDFKIHTARIETIYKELTPNSGSSLADSIHAIKEVVTRIEAWQKTRLSHENIAYYDMDTHFRIIWTNKPFLRLFNASESELFGFNIRNFIDFGDRERVAREQMAAVENGMDLKTSFRIVDANGDKKCVLSEALGVRDGKGNILGWTGTLTEKEEEYCSR